MFPNRENLSTGKPRSCAPESIACPGGTTPTIPSQPPVTARTLFGSDEDEDLAEDKYPVKTKTRTALTPSELTEEREAEVCQERTPDFTGEDALEGCYQ